MDDITFPSAIVVGNKTIHFYLFDSFDTAIQIQQFLTKID